ncbi:MAG TPA: 2-phospho-L-lactate transferase [Thermomicrobiales bacterium]|nr:2-phospho-L-lactate transferase [Thermomicrobiales bacterium]
MIAVLAGGVGGARFVDGVAQVAGAESVSAIVNTADDFDHYGLRICPDIDTVLYTLAGIADPVNGWGIAGDTRATLDGIAAYGEEPWFLLGDRDFSTHILRTAWLGNGIPLTSVIYFLRSRLGVGSQILPMSDESVATRILTTDGELAFQDYFVRRRQTDEVHGVRFAGIDSAQPTEAALTALSDAELILLAPSNPIVSIGPILAIPAYRRALQHRHRPVVAISPIIGGKALKGPADRMLASLGHESTALGVARVYAGLVDGFVIDAVDTDLAPDIEALGMDVLVTDAIMHDQADRGRFAREVLKFAQTIAVRTAV